MVEVTVEDRATLESWIRATTTEQRLVLRARIIMALARGRTNREVAEELPIRPATVSKWRTRFAGARGVAAAPCTFRGRPRAPLARRGRADGELLGHLPVGPSPSEGHDDAGPQDQTLLGGRGPDPGFQRSSVLDRHLYHDPHLLETMVALSAYLCK